MDHSEKISITKISRMGLLELIRKELIKDHIIEEFKITKQEEDFLKKQWCHSNSISNDKQLEKWKKENLQSDEDWKFFISRDLKWNKWCINKFKDKIKDLFKERKCFLDKYIYSIIRTKSEGLSKELYLRIKENESDFYKIAKEFSQGVEQKTGGLIGPTTLNNPHPIISNMLKESRDKQLWPPKKINEWWVIIRLEEKISATLNEDLKIKLVKELGELYLNNKLKEKIKDISI